MHVFRAIRSRLGVSQVEVASALGVSQANVSFYERGQTIPPAIAAKLIAYADGLGVKLTYDQIYGGAELPRARVLECRG